MPDLVTIATAAGVTIAALGFVFSWWRYNEGRYRSAAGAGREAAEKVATDNAAALGELRGRVDMVERAQDRLAAQAVTHEKLDQHLARIETLMADGFSGLRHEIRESNRRIDQYVFGQGQQSRDSKN